MRQEKERRRNDSTKIKREKGIKNTKYSVFKPSKMMLTKEGLYCLSSFSIILSSACTAINLKNPNEPNNFLGDFDSSNRTMEHEKAQRLICKGVEGWKLITLLTQVEL